MAEMELTQVQVGKQTVFATAVAGSAKLMGVTKCSIKPLVKGEARKYLRASLAPTYTVVVPEIGGEASLEEELSYEDVGYALDGIFGEATPSGAGPYVRAYTGPLGTKPTPRIQTLIHGDATDGVYKLTGAIPHKLVVKSTKTGILTATEDYFGYEVATGALAALSDRTVNPIMGSHVALYVDAWGGTIGTTAIAATMFDFELTIDTKRTVKRHMSVRPDGYKQPAWDTRLKLNLEFNATSKAYVDAILAVTPGAPFQRQIRIRATDSTRIAQFDFAGSQDQAPEIFTDEDGVCSVSLDLQGQYNSTLTNYLLASVTNAVSTLP